MATNKEQELFDVDEREQRDCGAGVDRRRFLAGLGAGALALSAGRALGQEKPMAPPSVVTTPPRDFGPNGAPTTYFWDPDVIAIDPSFNGLAQPNAPIQRLWVGAGGPKVRRGIQSASFLVWSDIPNNRQMRWIEDDGHVSVFRMPSNNSNGNTFDFHGRQISCEHLTRRVVRYELDGSITVLADSFKGKRLNSPNDAVPHPDGSIWFTDPPYGAQLYEGTPDPAGGKSNLKGKLNNRVGQPVGVSDTRQELPTQVYRWDPSGRLDVVIADDKVPNPNGLCFSPDFKKLYVSSTGPAGKGDIHVLDVGSDNKLSNQKVFTDCMVDGVKCGPDGFRCRRIRQSVVRQQCRPRGRLQRRHGVEPGRQAARPHPVARGVRQRHLRRPQAQSAVHGRKPVALRRLHGNPRRFPGLSSTRKH